MTFDKNGSSIYMYYTGSYPDISSSTKIWIVSESVVNGVWIIAYGDPIDHANSYSAGSPMEKQIVYLGKKSNN